MPGMAAPGWYSDNDAHDVLRWWDGTRWTGFTQPARSAHGWFAVPGPGTMAGRAQVDAGSVQEDVRMPGRKRDLQAEVERLREVVADIGARERDELRAEVGMLQQELPSIRNEHAGLLAAMGPLRAEAASLAAQRGQVVQAQAELRELRGQQAALAAASEEAERLTLALAKFRADQAELADR